MTPQHTHRDKLETLTLEIRGHADPQDWYTYLLLVRLQEDRLLQRVPALFRSRVRHFASHLAPLLTMAAVLLSAAYTRGSWHTFANAAALCLSFVPMYVTVAHLDWRNLHRVRQQLRLPARWDDYPRRASWR